MQDLRACQSCGHTIHLDDVKLLQILLLIPYDDLFSS